MVHEVLKAITLRITDDCDEIAEKHYEQCLSLRSCLSQGGYTMQAAELHKEFYNPNNVSKSYTSKPYFDMSGFTLGNNEFTTPPAAAIPKPNVWKPTNPPTHQALLMGNPPPRHNDDRSITSNTDNVSLANTFATFETNLTAAITTIFEEQEKARAIERKDAADAEAKREEQRRQDKLEREQQYRDEKQRMEKLELRRDQERADEILRRDKERAEEQFQNQKLMLQMMKDMFQPSTQQQQTSGTAPAQIFFELTITSRISPITPTGIHPRSLTDDLAAPMNRTKLNSDESEKKQKTDDRMNMDHENLHPKLPLPDGSQQ